MCTRFWLELGYLPSFIQVLLQQYLTCQRKLTTIEDAFTGENLGPWFVGARSGIHLVDTTGTRSAVDHAKSSEEQGFMATFGPQILGRRFYAYECVTLERSHLVPKARQVGP